jgi:hypothetical protein
MAMGGKVFLTKVLPNLAPVWFDGKVLGMFHFGGLSKSWSQSWPKLMWPFWTQIFVNVFLLFFSFA